jgi:iron complex transport system permease protein
VKRVLLVLCAALLVLGLSGFAQLYLGLPESESAEVKNFVLFQLRMPRLVIGFIVGATLALVGAAFQTLFRNPLATPSTVGTTAGAALGALFALTLGFRGAGAIPAATVFAFLGALGASSLVLAIATSARARMEEILLAGIAVTLGAGALAQGLQTIAGADALFASAQWSLGQLPQVGYDRVVLLLVPTLVCAVAILTQRRSLLALSLGEDWAKSVGVATNRVRLVLLIGGCLGVGASVALCGPIAFVGLLVPHVVRLLLGVDQTRLLPLSWISGGAFLVFSDLLAREILPQRELPVGVLTASLGSPALFLLILRRSPRTPVD